MIRNISSNTRHGCVLKENLQKTERDTYAATLAARIFRALITIIIVFDLETRQHDAVNAFVNNEINESIYCLPSDGFTSNMTANSVLFLFLRALYGLKQSPALWYRHFSTILNELGLEQVLDVECLFINDFMICFFFVNDITILYDRNFSQKIDDFQIQLFQRYESEWFYEIRITRDRYLRRMWLYQDSKLVAKFNIDISKRLPGSSLGQELIKNLDKAINQEIYAYQQPIESINYAAVIIRPDVAQATFKLSEFLINSSQMHMKSIDRVLTYLRHTKELFIIFDD